MWIHSRITPKQTEYLVALGRAIALAQNFECNCKFVFDSYDLAKELKTNKNAIQLWLTFKKKVNHQPLRNLLKKYDKVKFFRTHIPLLEAACQARNYLAHEAAAPALYIPPVMGKYNFIDLTLKTIDRQKIKKDRDEMALIYIRKMLPYFEQAVKDIAAADNLVSIWCYMIEEKDSQIPSIAQKYVDEIVKWVMEPIYS